jgi:Tfp pilus assembly protein PilF
LRRIRSNSFALFLVLLIVCLSRAAVLGQSGSVLYGDVIVDEGKSEGMRPLSYTLLLYGLNGFVIARQPVGANGRYRFINLKDGDYDLAVEVEGTEIGRMRVSIRNPVFKTDIRHDINLAWKNIGGGRSKPATITTEDYYQRDAVTRKLFDKARAALDDRRYVEAQALLQQLLAADPKDFQAWAELGTVFLAQSNSVAAEHAYQKAIDVRPGFFLALMNLGRLRMMQRRYEAAIPVLGRALEVKLTSAEANFYLGEAYLQIKKGSKAVGYFYEALRIDPVGRAEAHLRLAALYNGAGLKAKAANEYAEFLKKKPAYPDKKKLEAYIAQNRRP